MRILVMGGTRFIGVYLTRLLVDKGYDVTLCNRGNRPAPVAGVKEIHCDRTQPEALVEALSGQEFDIIFDNNGRKLSDTQPLTEIFLGKFQQLIYMSSAGVYLQSDVMPHWEGDPVDPDSRHKGKYETEAYLRHHDLPYTSIRPTYIYGPLNYNPLEAWFFDRIVRDRPIPIPGDGRHMTQIGHVADLASAMVATIHNPKVIGRVYNVSGDRFLTFDGLARICALAAGKSPDDVELVHYNPKQFDFGKRKAFPLRMQHFFTSNQRAKDELGWTPQFDAAAGLRDSFEKDYLANGGPDAAVDFSLDDEILKAVG